MPNDESRRDRLAREQAERVRLLEEAVTSYRAVVDRVDDDVRT